MRVRSLISPVLAFTLLMGAANATTVTFGDVTLDETAFADEVVLGDGNFVVQGAASPEEALAGSDGSSAASCVVGSGTCSFTVNFTDNLAVNGDGDDIIMFARGAGYELFDITINGITLAGQDALATGFKSFRYDLMSFAFNLSIFGISTGESINSMLVTIGVMGTNPEDFIAFAALNSAPNVLEVDENTLVNPLPAASLLYLTGFGAISGFVARRRKKTAAAKA